MRKKINKTDGIFPMPVLMVATYNADGSVTLVLYDKDTKGERHDWCYLIGDFNGFKRSKEYAMKRDEQLGVWWYTIPSVEKGREYLHPMTMKEVADAIGVHESTVSRAVANKYVEMPGGIAALRSFFTARLPGNGSEDFAANQAKAAIDKLIKGEDPKKPLSDQKICTMLKEQGLDLSRRTVMKYREQLGYASSVKRKRY